jgi:cyclic lactone autoinducer peptide
VITAVFYNFISRFLQLPAQKKIRVRIGVGRRYKAMGNKKNLSKKTEYVIAFMARKAAVVEANTACPFLHFQPKEPKEVKSLRRF